VSVTRRRLLGSGALAALGCAGRLPQAKTPADPPRPAAPRERAHLAAAQQIGRWLGAQARPTTAGVTWPADPLKPDRLDPTLYAGAAGVILFLVELHRATGDAEVLALARRGADDLATRVPDDPPPHLFGLYSGNEGIAFTLNEVFRVAGDERHRAAAARILRLVHERAKVDALGVLWNDSLDVMSGAAGTGLFLLWAERALDSTDSVALAARAGDALLARGAPAAGGLKWHSTIATEGLMPNFSHGTAGVAYFLASLYSETREGRFLDGALAGAHYLSAVERGGLVFHEEPGGEERFYLGWCHGPCGTGRFFHRLGRVTSQTRWRVAVERGGRALLASGIPGRRTSGFWNNVGQCCGSAGVAEYALHLQRLTGDGRYRTLADELTRDLLARGTRDQAGLRFVQAEHRIQPELLIAQTGWMQGAAGVGSWLLRLDAESTGRPVSVELPDCPFARQGGGTGT
jgi:lantibiotic modifying enzyme